MFSNETWSFSTWDLVRDKISKLSSKLHWAIILSLQMTHMTSLWTDTLPFTWDCTTTFRWFHFANFSINNSRYPLTKMFYNFYQSQSSYLVTTTFPKSSQNTQLFLPGERKYENNILIVLKIYLKICFRFHEINLQVFPFQFPPPLCQAEDSGGSQYFGLWKISRFIIRSIQLL